MNSRIPRFSELLEAAKQMPSNKILKLIEKVNKYVEYAAKKEVSGIEPDSTWESVYDFKPVTVSGKFVIIEYTDVHGSGKDKEKKERYSSNPDNESVIEELTYTLNWVIRSIKKGLRSEKIEIPNF